MALQALLRRYVPNTVDVAAVFAQSQALLADLSALKAADGASFVRGSFLLGLPLSWKPWAPLERQ